MLLKLESIVLFSFKFFSIFLVPNINKFLTNLPCQLSENYIAKLTFWFWLYIKDELDGKQKLRFLWKFQMKYQTYFFSCLRRCIILVFIFWTPSWIDLLVPATLSICFPLSSASDLGDGRGGLWLREWIFLQIFLGLCCTTHSRPTTYTYTQSWNPVYQYEQ